MGIFRFENKYAVPSKKQREKYMSGKSEEHCFGPDDQIVLIEYRDAAYLKDDIDGIRILFTGYHDKLKACDEVNRLVEFHLKKEQSKQSFGTGLHPKE
jgi:hypothetical protein